MKILRITAQGLPLFPNTLDLSFYAKQRVAEDDKEKLYPLFANIYMNCAGAFIGINASGKTSVLKVILLALRLLNSEPVNYIETKDILGDTKRAVLNLYFYTRAEEICRLETVIVSDLLRTDKEYYRIESETLWSKPASDVTTRKMLTDFSGYFPKMVRNDAGEFLSDDVSMVIAYNKKNQESIPAEDMLSFTNSNVLPVSDHIPAEIIAFLDPSVENLYFDMQDGKTAIHLKFYKKAEIIVNNPAELSIYLSSGTIKGIIAFMKVKKVLLNGGYLVVDEIENHFNKEIVTTLIRLFMDSRLNKNGASLLFTTHYPELLDEYDRNDGIYIVRNRNGITAENLSGLLKRNDVKKSEAYQSGLLEGTVPAYEAYMCLKKNFAEAMAQERRPLGA